MKKTVVAVLASAVASVAFTSSPASARSGIEGDNSPCVAQIEYQSLPGLIAHTAGTRAIIEDRWEVTGHGTFEVPGLGAVIRYERCGYALGDSFIGVAYDRNNHAWAEAIVTLNRNS